MVCKALSGWSGDPRTLFKERFYESLSSVFSEEEDLNKILFENEGFIIEKL